MRFGSECAQTQDQAERTELTTRSRKQDPLLPSGCAPGPSTGGAPGAPLLLGGHSGSDPRGPLRRADAGAPPGGEAPALERESGPRRAPMTLPASLATAVTREQRAWMTS